MLRRGITRNNIPASQDKNRVRADIRRSMFFILLSAIILFPAGLLVAEQPFDMLFRPIGNVRPLWQTNISEREWKTLNAPLLASVNFSSSSSEIDLHHFEMPCRNCHIPAGNSDPAVGPQDNIGPLRGEISSLCSSAGCHQFNPALNHSVGMVVSKNVTGGRPLDSQSRMTCLTCHYKDDTSNASSLVLDGLEGRKLHIPGGTDLCNSCHTRLGGGKKQQSHWQFSKKAHLGSISSRSSMLFEEEPSAGMLGDVDAESRTCVGCHSDVSITVPGEHETPTQRRTRRGKMTDHPIGMDYSRSSAGRTGRFRRIDRRMSDVRLFDGKVGCGSCHSLYSDTKGHIVRSDHGRSICSACHIR